MKILFIRHGETTDNLRHVYAGVTDSALTSHGVLQTSRLATYLGTTIPPITHIFASPLSRAKKTAEAIYDEQKRLAETRKTPSATKASSSNGGAADVNAPDVPEGGNPKDVGEESGSTAADRVIYFKIDQDLIEQDFGSYEGETFLTATPKKNLKKRKRSDSTSTVIENENETAESKKRRGSSVTNSPGVKGSTTTAPTSGTGATDVEMTAGEEGPLAGKTDDPISTDEQTKKETKVVEEEEEEEEFREMETPAAIKARADSFIRRCIVPLLPGDAALQPPSTTSTIEPPPHVDNPIVAIVSHGMLLSWLWKAFVALFPPTSVLATTPVVQKGWYQGKHPGWGNTGYLVVEVLPKGVVSKDGMTVVIEGVNEKAHLQGLRRTGGGVGSEKYDERQTKLDGFFGKKDGDTDSKL